MVKCNESLILVFTACVNIRGVLAIQGSGLEGFLHFRGLD